MTKDESMEVEGKGNRVMEGKGNTFMEGKTIVEGNQPARKPAGRKGIRTKTTCSTGQPKILSYLENKSMDQSTTKSINLKTECSSTEADISNTLLGVTTTEARNNTGHKNNTVNTEGYIVSLSKE